MDANKIIQEENESLGTVIQQLVDFDARQRALIANDLADREKQKSELNKKRSELEAKYIRQAQDRLERLEKSENDRADRIIKSIENASRRNISELEKKADENMEEWVNQIYKRTIEHPDD